MAPVVFWISLGMIVLPLAGYPALLFVAGRIRKQRKTFSFDVLPRVTCLVAARNEGNCIAGRIENLLSQDYPAELLEIIVGSDASTDGTDEIVGSYSDRGVVLHRSPERVGKSEIMVSLKSLATGEILVLTDANTVFRRDTVSQLVEPFSDPAIGCVDGSRRNSLAVETCESAYWRYETLLKRLCGRLGSVLGSTGAVFALRKGLFMSAGPKRADDFEIGVMVRMQGKECVFNPGAVALEPSDSDQSQYRRMVRIVAQYFGMAVRFFFMALGRGRLWLAIQLLLHKILRWQIGVFAVLAVVSLCLLAGTGPFYVTLLWLSVLFNLVAICGAFFRRGLPTLFLMPYYFWLMGISAIHGMAKLLLRGPTLLWDHEPRKQSVDIH
jgi:cellulose synthase/poly-beta-1,6-N-acetylglucosamine synthase-like glycosyltransferase